MHIEGMWRAVVYFSCILDMVNICEYGGYLGHVQKELGDGSLSSQGVHRVNDIFSMEFGSAVP